MAFVDILYSAFRIGQELAQLIARITIFHSCIVGRLLPSRLEP